MIIQESKIWDQKVTTLEQKFIKNSLWEITWKCYNLTVALRIARVNHACQPNAATIYDETARVAILFAQKDIQPGEEISICYYSPFFGLTPYVPSLRDESRIEQYRRRVEFLQESMALDHGITCPTDCSCHDPLFGL